ncbi:MAG TPA: MarR family transcriptional regulator [Candidatus Avidesulfovibrio excrementigallinarum]|nr:MarR family transcriptional regulator [Candidatus Avidesulfovibrio excrementigallinarum]
MSTLSYVPENSLGFMTITANRLMSALLRRKMREAGIDLSGEQWGILVILWDRGELSQEELTRLACMDKSAMSRLLSQLEMRELIARRPDAANARRKIIRVTDRAESLRERCTAAARAALEQALADVEEQDRLVCLKVLETVKRTLRQAP